MNIPYGGLSVANASTPQTLNAAPAQKLTPWTAAQPCSSSEGDGSIQSDLSNNRLLAAAGTFFLALNIAGSVVNAADDYQFGVYKNGLPTYDLATDAKVTLGGSDEIHSAIAGVVEVKPSDLTNGQCPLELYGSGSGNALTVRNAQMTALKIDGASYGSIVM
jgi:hypothetical protein